MHTRHVDNRRRRRVRGAVLFACTWLRNMSYDRKYQVELQVFNFTLQNLLQRLLFRLSKIDNCTGTARPAHELSSVLWPQPRAVHQLLFVPYIVIDCQKYHGRHIYRGVHPLCVSIVTLFTPSEPQLALQPAKTNQLMIRRSPRRFLTLDLVRVIIQDKTIIAHCHTLDCFITVVWMGVGIE